MLREPVGGGLGRPVELVGVSREMTAGVKLQPLGLTSPIERRQTKVGGTDDVGVAEHKIGQENPTKQIAQMIQNRFSNSNFVARKEGSVAGGRVGRKIERGREY